jgi:DnaJ-class molecular chaperone
MRDPYDILGVSRSAAEADIKRAFRKLAKQWHPDQNPTDPKAKDRFAEINGAYEILGDKDKRAQFDRGEIDAQGRPRFQGFPGGGFGAGGPRGGFGDDATFEFGFGGPGGRRGRGAGPGAGPGPDFDPGEFFSGLFGEQMKAAGRRGSTRGARRGSEKGGDVQAELTITLEDLVAGKPRRLRLPTGREIEVHMPREVADGQVIRLRGQGEPGPMGMDGDALLTLRLAPHPRYTVEGTDLRMRLPLPLADAVLGGALRVPTLEGTIETTIPPMTNSGRSFRFRGKGLPGKAGRGDLIVTVEVTLPEGADPELTELMRRRRERV